MEVSYKRDMNHTYMICRGERPVDTSAYPVRMMLSNQWKAFLPCRIQGMDNQIFFYYDITSRQSLASFFGTDKLSYPQLRSLVESLLAALEEAEEYLLDSSGILLEPAYIFWDSQEETFFFCYIPGEAVEEPGNMRKLTEYLLPRIDHKDQEAVVLGYGVYRKVMEENFCGAQLRELLYQSSGEQEKCDQEKEGDPPVREEEDRLSWWEDEEEEKEQKEKTFCRKELKVGLQTIGILFLGFLLLLAGTWANLPLAVKLAVAVGVLAAAVASLSREFRKEDSSGERGGRVDFSRGMDGEKNFPEIRVRINSENEKREEQSGEKATTLLFQDKTMTSAPVSHLVPQGRPELEPLRLEGEILLVGKLRGTVNLIINLPTVSRIHARLERRGETYYIQDLNSKNGTRVNHKELVGEEQVALRSGDRVAFADAVYLFRQGPEEET